MINKENKMKYIKGSKLFIFGLVSLIIFGAAVIFIKISDSSDTVNDSISMINSPSVSDLSEDLKMRDELISNLRNTIIEHEKQKRLDDMKCVLYRVYIQRCINMFNVLESLSSCVNCCGLADVVIKMNYEFKKIIEDGMSILGELE
jgi:hypothetical protein